ncbi:MAG: spondin domain-containing protein [Acidobacteriota bacterium]
MRGRLRFLMGRLLVKKVRSVLAIQHGARPVTALGLLILCSAPAFLEAQGATSSAQYTVRFDALWSRSTHPADFPPGPHFSPLVGATHQEGIRFWEVGTRATHGISRMAEEGRTRPLSAEIQSAIGAGTAEQVLLGEGIFPSPDTIELSFEISADFPAVTLVTMVAPSPDWFLGVSALPLMEGGDWVQEKVVSLFAYDAGTDSGTTFTSPDLGTEPPVPVERINSGPLANGVPLGTFTFTRTDLPPAPALPLRNDRFLLRMTWETPEGDRGVGQGTALTNDSATFWFFDADNIEVLVKVLDACSTFGHYWVFAAGLTNVGVMLEVEDTVTGVRRQYENPIGEPFAPIQDTRAFTQCP